MTVSFSRARAQVNLSAIARNYRRLTACGVPVMGVVKADAYGHGAVEIARALDPESAGAEAGRKLAPDLRSRFWPQLLLAQFARQPHLVESQAELGLPTLDLSFYRL